MNDDIWSRQFYKALEVVGNLTEQERLKLGNMLIALSPVKQTEKVLRAIEDAQSSLEEQKRIAELKRRLSKIEASMQPVGASLFPALPKLTGQGYQPVKSETSGEIKSPPKKL